MKKTSSLEQYFTPEIAIQGLIDKLNFPLTGKILEPFCGHGRISNFLRKKGFEVITNDIDTSFPADYYCDLRVDDQWEYLFSQFLTDWIITNPPFSLAPTFIPDAYKSVRVGLICLLRLSYLEPCKNRKDWLKAHPPEQVLVTKRMSFTGNRKDTVTTAWLIWTKNIVPNDYLCPPIDFIC